MKEGMCCKGTKRGCSFSIASIKLKEGSSPYFITEHGWEVKHR
jgi:hypothetical protein